MPAARDGNFSERVQTGRGRRVRGVAGCAAPTGDVSTVSSPVRIDEASLAAGAARVDLTQPVVYEIDLPASAHERVVVHTCRCWRWGRPTTR